MHVHKITINKYFDKSGLLMECKELTPSEIQQRIIIILSNLKIAILQQVFIDYFAKFSKQQRMNNYYPRLQFYFKKTFFSEEIGTLLHKIEFNHSTWEDKRFQNPLIVYQISGIENLKRWMQVINPMNPVHKTKYEFWQKYGYYLPKSA